MFDIGFWELVLVGIVALLVLGPERLPAAATTVGRWAGHARNLARQFRAEMEREARAGGAADEARKLIKDTRDEMAGVERGLKDAGEDLNDRR